MITLFNEILYRPFINALILIYNAIPGHDFGLAIIVLTVAVRLILMPLSVKALISQRSVAKIQPKIRELQTKYKNDKEALTRETMALYKDNGVNPMSGCLPLLIQIPILLALYRSFSVGFKKESLALLYKFIPNPGSIQSIAFGFLDLSKPNHIMAIAAGVGQFIQTWLMTRQQPVATDKSDPMASMNKQMLYIFPVFIIIIAWRLPAGLTVYWLTATLFSIFEQFYVRGKVKTVTK